MRRSASQLDRVALGIGALAACVVLGCAHAAKAQVNVEMSANRNELTMDDNVVVNVSVQLQSSDSPRIELPDFDGFQVVQRSVQRPMQFSFGFGQQAPVVTSTTQYTFVLAPRAPGRYQLRPARVTMGKHVFQSQPLTLIVRAAGAAPQASNDPRVQAAQAANAANGQAEPGAQNAAPTAARDSGDTYTYNDDAFLRTVVDKVAPYEGEQVTATIYLYTRRNLQSAPEITTEPSTDGFWTHDLLAARRSMEPTHQVVNGRTFWVYVLHRFAAFPLKAGDLTIGALSLTLSRETIFDMFDPQRAEPNLQRSGVPLVVHVKPLPENGKPAGSVAIGDFELTAQLDRAQVVTGDAVTLTATVRGHGNVRAVNVATPSVPGLQILQPETHEVVESPSDLVQGTRTFAWLIVPSAPGTYTIPSVSLDVFDTASGSYKRVQSQPLQLTAAGNAHAPTLAQPGPGRGTVDVAPEAPRPAAEESWPPIRTRSALLRKQAKLAAQPFYPWALGSGPALWLLAISVPAARRRVQQRKQRGGPREVLRQARARLALAKDALSAKDAKVFHTELAGALQLALEARASVVATGLTRPQLRTALDAQGLPEGATRELIDVLDRCDFARFSTAAVSEQDMQALLTRATTLVDGLARFNAASEAAT